MYVLKAYSTVSSTHDVRTDKLSESSIVKPLLSSAYYGYGSLRRGTNTVDSSFILCLFMFVV